MYITAEGTRLSIDDVNEDESSNQLLDYDQVMKTISAVGVKSQDPRELDYWGLPAGLVAKLKTQTKIQKLFQW